MKKLTYILLCLTMIYFSSCSNSPTEKAKSQVKSYLKENLKIPDSYESISFSSLDTLSKKDTTESKQISFYEITHSYQITNSEKEKIKMTVTFYLDKDLNVTEPNTKSLNGDYGILTGNAYWKFNNYVGNKPDAGAKIYLYSLDSIRGNLKYETTADVYGNYKLDKILCGRYLLIVRSENATDCPESHLQNLTIYSDELKQLFNFDLDKYKDKATEINKLDSIYTTILLDDNDSKYGGLEKKIDKYTEIETKIREKSELLINSFPDEFKMKLNFFSAYNNAFDFSIIRIEENKTTNNNTDFGITCI